MILDDEDPKTLKENQFMKAKKSYYILAGHKFNKSYLEDIHDNLEAIAISQGKSIL